MIRSHCYIKIEAKKKLRTQFIWMTFVVETARKSSFHIGYDREKEGKLHKTKQSKTPKSPNNIEFSEFIALE